MAKPPLSLAGGLDVGNFKNYSDLHEGKQPPAHAPRRSTEHGHSSQQGNKPKQDLAQPAPKKPALRSTFQENGAPLNIRETTSPAKNINPRPRPQLEKSRQYNRSVRRGIKKYNREWAPRGNAKLFARENRWGPPVKIQSCYGDNIMTVFNVIDKGKAGALSFQYKNVTRRHKGRTRHKWNTAIARTIIRGRYIILRARSSKGAGVISLRIRGNCIEAPPIPESAGKTNNPKSNSLPSHPAQ